MQTFDNLQLDHDIEEVGADTLIIKVLPKELCNVNGLVLWQLGGTGNVEEQSTQPRKRRLFISAAWDTFIMAASLGPTAIVTTVVVVIVICAAMSVLSREYGYCAE